MKRIHRYVLKTFVGPFFMTFFICLFVFLMQFIWKYIDDLVGKGLEWKILGEFLFYSLFSLLSYTFPLSMLLASIMTFGELGENYELVAMKSSGISLFNIMRPLVFVAIIMSGVAFFFANNILPYTNLRLQTLLYSIRQQRPELVLKEGVFTNDVDGYSIRIGSKHKKNNTLYDILIYDHTNGKGNESVTVADSGYLRMTEDKNYMVMTLYDGENFVEEKGQGAQRNNYPFRFDKFEMQEINVKVRNFDFNRRDESIYRNSYKAMSTKQLIYVEDSLITDYRQWLKSFLKTTRFTNELDKRLTSYATEDDSLLRVYNQEPYQIFNYDSLINSIPVRNLIDLNKTAVSKARNNYQEINNIENNLYGRKKRINLHMMERHRKFTLSVAVFVFFLIGAPLGAIIRKGGLGMPVVISILLFILYYIVSMTGEKSAREDIWNMTPGMWFSTLIFLPVGIWLTQKAMTDSPVMSSETYINLIKKLKSFFVKEKTNSNEASATDQ